MKKKEGLQEDKKTQSTSSYARKRSIRTSMKGGN
jgi:hypothetical protein